MKRILFLLLLTTSCGVSKDSITVTDLNTSGKVVKIDKCNSCQSGDYIYTIELDPDEEACVKYITNNIYRIGDWIYLETNISDDKR